MVLIESKKYACETCIKGHRSSACKHTDRALYEIKKKGRPVTQCEHCRELRKTKQVHVKCICQKEEIVTGVERTSGCSKQAVNKMLESAAFPNGLPKALEASVAVQLLSQGATSDSDLDGCSCLSGDECHCWTPRKVAPRGGKKGKSIAELPASTSSPSPESSTPAKVENTSSVQNRLADLRTLLPKPAHDPSASTAVHPVGRSHPHELYSPYGRAHDQVHPNHSIRHTSKSPQTDKPSSALPVTHPFDIQRSFYPVDRSAYSSGAPLAGDALQAIYPEFDAADIEAWKSFQMSGFASIAGSLCGCGDECACPGCIVHKPNISRTADASKCGQPDGCRDCMDCSASFSYQSSQGLPPNTALSIYSNAFSLSGGSSIDDWIQQMQSSIPASQLSPAFDTLSRNQNVSSSDLTSNPASVASRMDDLVFQGPLTGMMHPDGSADPGALFGRSRSFDDLFSTYPSTFDTSIPLDLSYLNSSSHDLLSSTSLDLAPLQNAAPTSVSLDLDGVYRSRSASVTSSETSGHDENTSLNAFSDLGEMSSMSMFYHHSGTGAGGGRSSVRSLPDTLGYF